MNKDQSQWTVWHNYRGSKTWSPQFSDVFDHTQKFSSTLHADFFQTQQNDISVNILHLEGYSIKMHAHEKLPPKWISSDMKWVATVSANKPITDFIYYENLKSQYLQLFQTYIKLWTVPYSMTKMEQSCPLNKNSRILWALSMTQATTHCQFVCLRGASW